MKLDRNLNHDGHGKYALLKLRELDHLDDAGSMLTFYNGIPRGIRNALKTLENAGILDWGDTEDSEFFVIRLKDVNTQAALIAYAGAAKRDDAEWAREILALAARSGPNHPHCKRPD